MSASEVQSYGTWSTVVDRSGATLIRPGAPLHITSISISNILQAPKNMRQGVLRSVLFLSSRLRGAPEASSRVIVGALVPEKTENFDCNIRLFPHKEYTLEVHGSDVHVLGEFIGKGPAIDFPQTEIRKILRPPVGNRAGTTGGIQLPSTTQMHRPQTGTQSRQDGHSWDDYEEGRAGPSKRRKAEWAAGTS